MFALFESFPDADFGWPGPLTHEIEAMGEYEESLRDSLHRAPALATVDLLMRILNSDLPDNDRQAWLSEAAAVLNHPKTTPDTKDGLEEYFESKGEHEET
jgi:hypothetical protein